MNKPKENFTQEFKRIYFRHLNFDIVKTTPQVIEEIMQEKAKKQLEGLEVEDFLIDEINQNRKNTFSEENINKLSKGKGDKDEKSDYNKFFIEFPKIYPTNANLKFSNISNSRKKDTSSNFLNESSLDKSKILRGLSTNDKIHKFNTKLKNVEDIIKKSPTLKKNVKSLMNNFYTTGDKTKTNSKFKLHKSLANSYMNKTSMISDILTTHQSTVAMTEDNYTFKKPLSERKFQINPRYIKQINNISNDPTINHLLNVIEHQHKVKNVINRINYVEKNIKDSWENSQRVLDFYEKRSYDIKKKYKNIVSQSFPDLY